MANTRVRLFEDGDDIDLSSFKPKEPADRMAPPAEQVKTVSESANFRSREPTNEASASPSPPEASKPKRQPRTHRTGRNVQFNVKASQDAVDAFYRISDEQEWVLGETLERALAALERELKGQGSR
jgi:hypothetical protein